MQRPQTQSRASDRLNESQTRDHKRAISGMQVQDLSERRRARPDQGSLLRQARVHVRERRTWLGMMIIY